MTSRVALTAFAFSMLLTASAQAGLIFWTDLDGAATSDASIKRANADGSNVTAVVTGLTDTRGIAVDAQGDMMYWTSVVAPYRILRANLDGTNIVEIVQTQVISSGIAVDLAVGKIYWTGSSDMAGQPGQVWRANLDGSAAELLVTIGLEHPSGIALDTLGGKMYWTDLQGIPDGRIQRADLDGSNVETLLAGIDQAHGIALDITGGKMYWPNLTAGTIQRANLDGSGVVDLVVGLDMPSTIALDVLEGKMYWTDSGGQTNRIERANLDGSGVEVIVSGVGYPFGIAVLPTSTPVPTVSEWGLVVMSLLTLTAGTMIFVRRQRRRSC